MVKYIYGGNHSFLVLHDLFDKMSTTPLRVQEIFDDRFSYFLTFEQCARLLAKFHSAAVSRSVGHATAWNLKKLLGEGTL
jgi:cyclopropane-fatty-acyl-phospholipid synthase